MRPDVPSDPTAPDTLELRDVVQYLRANGGASDALASELSDARLSAAAASWLAVRARIEAGRADGRMVVGQAEGANAPGDVRRWSDRRLLERGSLRTWPLPGNLFVRGSLFKRRALGTLAVLSVAVTMVTMLQRSMWPDDVSLTRTYTTTAGQQAAVKLTDGSQVVLGPATTLVVAMRSSDSAMTVHLTGQALFTVASHRRMPFVVHAGVAITSVLGTTFFIRRYDTDHITRVVVDDGRVSVSSVRGTQTAQTSRILATNMLGTVDDSGQVQVAPSVNTDVYTRWTRGQLVFQQTPVRDVVLELGRAYGVDLRVADSALAAHPLDWTVSLTQWSITDVVNVLAAVLDAHPVRSGSVITLVPGRLAPQRPVGPSPFLPSERQYGR